MYVNGKRQFRVHSPPCHHIVYTHIHSYAARLFFFLILRCSQFTVSDSHPGGLAVCPQMPILKPRWSILGPKGLSIQWRSLLSPPASFSMISSARRSQVKRLNPSQVRLTCPFTVLSYQLNSLECYKQSVCWSWCDELFLVQKIVKPALFYWKQRCPAVCVFCDKAGTFTSCVFHKNDRTNTVRLQHGW